MRVLFFGTPAFGVPTLRLLLSDARFQVAGVVTQPDRPRGRGLESAASAVKESALEAGLEIFQPEKIRAPESRQWIEQKSPEAIVLIAYGQIIPAELLPIPRLGWINLHASLLPRYRGAAPIAWCIANGDTRTGVTTMQIDAGLDTGATLLARETQIRPEETTPELTERLAQLGAPLAIETLDRLAAGTLAGRPQDNSTASYAPPLERADGRIRWKLSAQQIYNRMRAFTPWPGTFSQFRGARVSLWGRPWAVAGTGAPAPAAENAAPGTIVQVAGDLLVACGQHTWLQVVEAQAEGRRRVTAREFIAGARLAASGERFE